MSEFRDLFVASVRSPSYLDVEVSCLRFFSSCVSQSTLVCPVRDNFPVFALSEWVRMGSLPFWACLIYFRKCVPWSPWMAFPLFPFVNANAPQVLAFGLVSLGHVAACTCGHLVHCSPLVERGVGNPDCFATAGSLQYSSLVVLVAGKDHNTIFAGYWRIVMMTIQIALRVPTVTQYITGRLLKAMLVVQTTLQLLAIYDSLVWLFWWLVNTIMPDFAAHLLKVVTSIQIVSPASTVMQCDVGRWLKAMVVIHIALFMPTVILRNAGHQLIVVEIVKTINCFFFFALQTLYISSFPWPACHFTFSFTLCLACVLFAFVLMPCFGWPVCLCFFCFGLCAQLCMACVPLKSCIGCLA